MLASRNADSCPEVPEEMRSTHPWELPLKVGLDTTHVPTPVGSYW
jgi:hypothetical protein